MDKTVNSNNALKSEKNDLFDKIKQVLEEIKISTKKLKGKEHGTGRFKQIKQP